MRPTPPLPVILFLDPYLAAKVQLRAMEAANVLGQRVSEAQLITHVLTVFFHREREILGLLYPAPVHAPRARE